MRVHRYAVFAALGLTLGLVLILGPVPEKARA